MYLTALSVEILPFSILGVGNMEVDIVILQPVPVLHSRPRKFDVVYLQYIRKLYQAGAPSMAVIKSETITVRIEPAVKEGLKAMAEKERRSQANMIEIIIRDYCKRNGVVITEEHGGR